ncbi:MAG: sugar kinase [Bryobacteraceae bacterium]|nr:sugar kinase [Bryobacteraceae bacterium]
MSLVVVGSVAYDGVETPGAQVDRILGGACTYISVAASFFTKVSIVGVVGEDFAEEDIAFLGSRGVDLTGLERAAGKTFFWRGRYAEDMNTRTTLQTDLNVFADFQPKLPESHRGYPYLLLGNIQPSLQQQVLEQMKSPRVVAGDTMDLWIQTTRDDLVATIRHWDALIINDQEARMLSGETNLRRAARIIMAMGPNTLIIKRGEFGAILFHRDCLFYAPGYLLEEVFDPTGAGDSFAGGFMGYVAQKGLQLSAPDLDMRELARAVIYGSVMGSFCCEKFGVDRFRDLTRAEIDARFQEFRTFTGF